MRKIEPVSLWVNGQIKEANTIDLISVNDNLKDSAVFYYSLICELVQEDGTVYSQSLAQGNLSMNGQDYIDWGFATDLNQWAYEWAAIQLNIILATELEKAILDTQETSG